MNPGEQQRGRGSSPGLRRGLLAWALWVLASTVGGALGGAAFVLLSFFGFFLYGAFLGTAQALVLRRYPAERGNNAEAVSYWVLANFLGWFVGSLVVSVAQQALAGLVGVPEVTQQVGSAIAGPVGAQAARTTFPFFSSLWVLLAASQGAALALGRRTSVPLTALWVLASAVGGVLSVAVSVYFDRAVLPGGGPDLFFDQVLPMAVEQAAAGALYGAVTGVVLALIVRRAG